MKVMKFGGSCLQSAAGLKRLIELVAREARPVAIVLSALKGVTDDLIALTESAAKGAAPEQESRLRDLRTRHEEALRALGPEHRAAAERGMEALLRELTDLLRGVQFLRE